MSKRSVIVEVVGEVDLLSTVGLSRHLELAMADGAAQLCLDLGNVTFIDSAGLSVLIRLWKRLSADGRELCIVRASDWVRHFFEKLKLSFFLPDAMPSDAPAMATRFSAFSESPEQTRNLSHSDRRELVDIIARACSVAVGWLSEFAGPMAIEGRQVLIRPMDEIFDGQKTQRPIIGIHQPIMGQYFNGNAFLLLTATRPISTERGGATIGNAELEVLSRVANVLTGALLDALRHSLRLDVRPGLRVAQTERVTQILGRLRGRSDDWSLIIDIHFNMQPDISVHCVLVLLTSRADLETLFAHLPSHTR